MLLELPTLLEMEDDEEVEDWGIEEGEWFEDTVVEDEVDEDIVRSEDEQGAWVGFCGCCKHLDILKIVAGFRNFSSSLFLVVLWKLFAEFW